MVLIMLLIFHHHKVIIMIIIMIISPITIIIIIIIKISIPHRRTHLSKDVFIILILPVTLRLHVELVVIIIIIIIITTITNLIHLLLHHIRLVPIKLHFYHLLVKLSLSVTHVGNQVIILLNVLTKLLH